MAFHDVIAKGLEFGIISTFKEIATLIDMELGFQLRPFKAGGAGKSSTGRKKQTLYILGFVFILLVLDAICLNGLTDGITVGIAAYLALHVAGQPVFHFDDAIA